MKFSVLIIMITVGNSQLHIQPFPLETFKLSMFDALSSKEKVDASRIELIDALEQHRKIFSSYYKPETTLEDLGLDFQNLNYKTHNFIRVAMRHIEELENLVEKYEFVNNKAFPNTMILK